MKLLRTIHGRLFISHACIILALILALTVLFYNYTATILENRASESLQQLAININQYLDAEFKFMNETAGRIISSQPIKNRYYNQSTDEFTYLENQLELFDLLFTVTGASVPYQINIVGNNGHLVQFGKYNDVTLISPEKVVATTWFASCLEMNGKPLLTPPRESEWNRQNDQVISVCRALNRDFGSTYDSAVEVQIPYDNIRRLIQNSIVLPDNQSNLGVVAFVYGTNGSQVYAPDDVEYDTSDYYTNAQDSGERYGTINRKVHNEILAYSVSSFSGWTVVVREQDDQLLAQVNHFRNWVLIMGFVALCITLFITYLIAQQLTVPIRDIQSSINRLNLSKLGEEALPKENPSTYELHKLNTTYQRMVERLEHSLNETVDARLQEMRARFLALQAQMDPHFLYNTITIISIKAENNGDDEVVALCENLTGMLRYVSNEAISSVTIAVELDHLTQYLSLMESRYSGQFRVDIDIPQRLREIEVPKLILQPIIENCFKYAFDIHPPWVVCIKGEIIEDCWRISITDNGKGFSQQALDTVYNRINLEDFHFATNETDKIGLLNIYYRLRFLYKEFAVFEIENCKEGGSCVTIGGLVKGRDIDEW